jgi:hypothetical protein
MKTLKIRKGTVFYRVEINERKRYDNPKFYAYFRDETCSKKTWANRCENYCRYLEVAAKRDLKFINVPYKSVYLIEDVTENDMILAKTFIKLAKRVYKGDTAKIKCVTEAVRELILLKQADHLKCADLLSDYTLARLVCKAGFDGMVRFVLSDRPHCSDEVAICSPDDKLEIIKEEMLM